MFHTYHPEGPNDSALNFPRFASDSMDSIANLYIQGIIDHIVVYVIQTLHSETLFNIKGLG